MDRRMIALIGVAELFWLAACTQSPSNSDADSDGEGDVDGEADSDSDTDADSDTDTSGGAHLQFEDRLTADDDWVALGLGEQEVAWSIYPRDLTDGLITEDNIYAVVPSDQYP